MPEDPRGLWTGRFRNVALGLHRRFIIGVIASFVVVVSGSIAVGLAELYPPGARWFVYAFLATIVALVVFLWKARKA